LVISAAQTDPLLLGIHVTAVCPPKDGNTTPSLLVNNRVDSNPLFHWTNPLAIVFRVWELYAVIGKDLLVVAKPIFQQFPKASYFIHQFGIACSDGPIMNGPDTLAENSEGVGDLRSRTEEYNAGVQNSMFQKTPMVAGEAPWLKTGQAAQGLLEAVVTPFDLTDGVCCQFLLFLGGEAQVCGAGLLLAKK
jgi:hypothetical protein